MWISKTHLRRQHEHDEGGEAAVKEKHESQPTSKAHRIHVTLMYDGEDEERNATAT
jgi:hypothetical protein